MAIEQTQKGRNSELFSLIPGTLKGYSNGFDNGPGFSSLAQVGLPPFDFALLGSTSAKKIRLRGHETIQNPRESQSSSPPWNRFPNRLPPHLPLKVQPKSTYQLRLLIHRRGTAPLETEGTSRVKKQKRLDREDRIHR